MESLIRLTGLPAGLCYFLLSYSLTFLPWYIIPHRNTHIDLTKFLRSSGQNII